MRTKIVYVVSSSLNDVYWEQVWLSAWSVKIKNPSARISLVGDTTTFEIARNSYRINSFELFDDFISHEFDDATTNMERSRWLKTNLRSIIKGDFLYIDSDTIITDDLSEVDGFDFDIGMIYDLHLGPSTDPELHKWHNWLYKKAYGHEYPIEVPYYNGGVIYAKDNEKAKLFFKKWHENWEITGNKVGFKDQTPLAKTVYELKEPISPMSGIYNCQICNCIRYLHNAKIVHFFNHAWYKPAIHPLMILETYKQIQTKGNIPEELKEIALNCKSQFFIVSPPLGMEVTLFLQSVLIYNILFPFYTKNKKLFNVINKGIHILAHVGWILLGRVYITGKKYINREIGLLHTMILHFELKKSKVNKIKLHKTKATGSLC